jgi:hypothetical protein
METAKAIVILCNKQSSDPNHEDSKTILQAMVIKKYLKLNGAPNSRICMQLLRPEGKMHYYLSLNKQTKWDQVVCIEELKLSLLAKSCLCPGLVALISNLITSSGEPPSKSELESDWLEEYWRGKQFEIYRTHFPPRYIGKTFSWVATNIYRNFRAILFAIEIHDRVPSRIIPNPGEYVITDRSKVSGYIISEDKSVADEISNLKAGDDDFARRKSLGRSMINSSRSIRAARANSLAGGERDDDAETNDDEITMKIRKEKFAGLQTGELNKLEKKCHITHSKINIADVTFKTLEHNQIAMDHIILCGMVPNLINFVLPLRAKYLTKYPPIVILHTDPPNEKQWSQICLFPEVYYVRVS